MIAVCRSHGDVLPSVVLLNEQFCMAACGADRGAGRGDAPALLAELRGLCSQCPCSPSVLV